MMKQRLGLDRNVLRPPPGDPWGVKQHHWNIGRASTNFQNQEVQDFQPSKFESEANETWTMKHQKISFFSGFKRSHK